MKQFLALTLLSVAPLMASEEASVIAYEQNSCTTCRCSPCCCVPQPKKCIDCECYTPSFYNLQCDFGLSLDFEFLYWYGRETDFPVIQIALIKSEDPIDPDALTSPFLQSIEHFKATWDPGFRLGLGWNSDCDGWDLLADWTYYHNTSSLNRSVPPFNPGLSATLEIGDELIINNWANVHLPSIKRTFEQIKAKWKLNFNQVDLTLGRKYWLSPCFAMRTFGGLRGAWTKTTFTIDASFGPGIIGSDQTVFLTAHDRFRNKVWGVGPFVGIEPTWYLCQTFAVYSKLGVSAIWGKFRGKKDEEYSRKVTGVGFLPNFDQTNTTSMNYSNLSTIVDLGIGLRWEDTWCCDRYRTTLDLGWEHHSWLLFGVYVETDTPALDYDYKHTHLVYGGLVVRLRFDF